ncbi:hypothetical protein TNIN_128921 [Trichonephila inaurata madagascariensis]|uniref:Uncharacterized protein n=1 Tax=Trichonephila inaurata madagascariensis TaxID=2747483 RepID=A0A8X6YPJ7_9ARAC|nr:hypothetical protein TNIN_128921 [Trichonephila inaurata madagascariensis]
MQVKPRHKTATVEGTSTIFERLLKLDDRMKTKIRSFLSRDTMRMRCRLWRTDTGTVTPVSFFARTALSVKKVNFLWDIERFSCLKSGEEVDFVLRSESEDDEATLSLRVNET